MPALTGTIFEIQRFCIHDGPGIRTTVFLKGCPLNCLWCHNPEGISPLPQLSYIPEKCIVCGACRDACPNGAHRIIGKRHVFERCLCRSCSECTQTCYSGALELAGREVSVEAVMANVMRDLPFYETSGGGMTLSGGEPMAQPRFVLALLKAARENGLHTCLETSGHAAYRHFERALPYVDLFLYDIKEMDEARHKAFTGVSNQRILENLHKLHDLGAYILLRLPLIPGFNDHIEHFQGIADLAQSLPGLQGIQILPYHALGGSKRVRFGLEPAPPATVPDPALIAGWIEQLESLGITNLVRSI